MSKEEINEVERVEERIEARLIELMEGLAEKFNY
jgi:hypothetical protein